MKRNWVFLRPSWGSYGEFIEFEITESRLGNNSSMLAVKEFI
jgi:hypothetical protein